MKHRMPLCALVVVMWPTLAEAHMKLMYPPSRWVENNQGDPQKDPAPCGGGPGAAATKIRTKFKPGQTITVIWKETIHHPGHFRIAFDDNGEDAFKNPADAKDIIEPPVMPVLKDGLFPNHTSGQMMKADITLPNTPCKNCTLQIIQAMTAGTSVSMYYHCADLELTGDAGDGGADPAPGQDAGGGYGGAGGATGGAGGSSIPPPGTGGTGGGAAGAGGSGGAAGSGGAGGSSGATGGSTGGSAGSNGATAGSGGGAGTTPSGSVDASGGKASSDVSGSFSGCVFGAQGHPASVPIFVAMALVLGRLARRSSPRRRR
jgi:hypothetical protein